MKTRTLKDWIILVRPWSFPASIVPCLATTAYLFFISRQGSEFTFDWINAALAFPLLVLLHAAGNTIGDYYDHIRKVDLPNSLNQVRCIYDGTFSPKEVFRTGIVMLVLASILGLVLLYRTSWSAIWFGIAGIVLTGCYFWFKKHAMGDLDVLLGFAILPSLGIAYVTTGQYLVEPMLLSIPFGLLTVSILHANNTRDILNDTRAGLTTLSICLGGRTSQIVYAAELIVPYVLVLALCCVGWLPWFSLITFLTLPIAAKNIRIMLNAEPLAEAPIGSLDQQSAQLQLMFGLLYTLAFIIAAFI